MLCCMYSWTLELALCKYITASHDLEHDCDIVLVPTCMIALILTQCIYFEITGSKLVRQVQLSD
jgi:hypothetical protein